MAALVADGLRVLRVIRLRYDASCAACGVAMLAGTEATWDRATREAACAVCAAGIVDADRAASVLDPGVAGASARRIADRQRAKRERAKEARDAATRRSHPRLGELIVKTRDFLAEPEKPTSWQKGADGEEAVGRTLDRLCEEGFAVLHDHRKPGTRWNIDHIVVGPRGVYVIDAKHYSGRLEIRPTGTFLRPGPRRVVVNGRPQDKRVAALDWQVACVNDAAGALIERCGGVIKPVLCFIGVEVALTQRPDLVGVNNVLVTWPRRFVKDVGRDGPLGPERIQEVARTIAAALRPAVSSRSARR